MNRTARRALKRDAPDMAEKLANSCLDYQGGALVKVTDPKAIAALRRAFRRMIEAGAKPLALPITEEEANGFPRHASNRIKGGVSWLAVGFDPASRGAYALQSATSTFRPAAHDAAKEKALANLAMICAAPGFPPMPKNTGGVVCDVPNLSSTYPVCGPKRKPSAPFEKNQGNQNARP